MVMVAVRHSERLVDRLPRVRGSYEEGANIGRRTWFRTGGAAEVLYQPVDADDLQTFLEDKPADVRLTVIGFGSNLLVRDGGIDGVVIVLGEGFSEIEFDGSVAVAGAAALDVNVARAAQQRGITGLEFLSGIPGTIGGAVRMNAGAYGGEIGGVVIDVIALDASGGAHVVESKKLDFSYRRCALPEDWIVLSARLRGQVGDPEEIAACMATIAAARSESQPKTRTGGSTFANPPGYKAWKLIDDAGCRGLRRGGAMVSEQHCNFLLNLGDATSSDIELLGEEVRCRVLEHSGVHLEWEIRRIGNACRGAKP
ncbi:MAG: UDP-N-acetylmuramate dehydrogenase [Rickettsiales bacterium]|jgi:UDP-N-acetylmuramate dehydrogenase